jgi:hypothetical protein
MTPHLRIQVEVEDRVEKKSETSKPHLKKPSMIGHHLVVLIGHDSAEMMVSPHHCQTPTNPVRA